MSAIRDNWRIVLLVTLIVLSSVALFVPGATAGGASNDTSAEASPTNLQYGINLDGGARIRAPIVGITAENVEVPTNRTAVDDLRTGVANDLGLDSIDVEVRPQENTVEVFSRNVTRAELASTLQDRGYDVGESDVREGVTQPTRDEMVSVIDEKLQVSALTGADVRQARSPTGEHYIVVEATGRDVSELRSVLSDRGVVRMNATYRPPGGELVREQVLTQSDITRVGTIRQASDGGYAVPVTLTDAVAQEFTQTMQEAGYTPANIPPGRGATRCNYDRENPNQTTGRCWVATLDGEVIFSGPVERSLAQSFADGSFVDDPTFQMSTQTREEARDLELSLKSGQPLPAPLNFEDAQTLSLQPALADRYKVNSLITGLVAVLAVSGVVYARYEDVRVAAPMVVTALSEVVLLLGLVAAIQFPLDLSYIAGFIAVIGTGVDDLIIIADEILQEKGVATGRVFQNRFRKAFWVIGAAAATTIVAMSPLTVLSLGDLTGFAIITIIGVLIGVLVTRPAYGDVLRHLMLDEES